ncbi:MAG: acylphosphatase [Anaerolineae bacterium]|jgi:acylphosphatase|nr:acylphosphatase [Anaerolineae bacterium]
MNEPRRIHGFVSGRVQGVGFRYFTQQTATELGVTGWVKNTYDGKVEFVAEGTEEQLTKFRRKLSRGPASAYVSDLTVENISGKGEFSTFRVRF